MTKTTVHLNRNTTNSNNHMNNHNNKTRRRGAKEALQTKRSYPQPQLKNLNHNADGPLQNVERNHKALDNPTHKKEKQTIPPTSSQPNTEETPSGADVHGHNRRKNFLQRSEQAATTVRNKIKQQFGFVADPTKTLLHNASSTLAHTPTWYYFSRPSHFAFHDFTRSKQPAKNLRSLLGLGLKFIPTPHYTNTWKKLKELSMPKFKRAIHLCFHFSGTNTTPEDTYDPKIYVRSNGTPPHWTLPPVVMKERLVKFLTTLGKLFKKTNGKNKPPTLSDGCLTTTSTTTRFPRLPMRQKPWAGDHRTR